MLEPILNPIWVMIAAHERPSGWSLVGGCLVLSASLARSILVSRDASRLSESSSAARIKRALANP
jgi:hypothetical protein